MSFVIENNVLLTYVYEGETVVCVPEGVECIGPDAFKQLGYRIEKREETGGWCGDVYCNGTCDPCMSTITIEVNIPLDERCKSVEKIVLPATVRKICSGAFEKCYWLRTVVIPESVTEIGDSAFGDYDALVICAPKESCAQKYAEEHGFYCKEM